MYDDPISHFKEIAKQKNVDKITEYTIKNINTKIIDDTYSRKNLGYLIIKKIYTELGVKTFLNNKNKSLNVDYDLNSILELLVYSRILSPNSKLSTYNNKKNFFENFDFSLKDMYRSLNNFHCTTIKKWV